MGDSRKIERLIPRSELPIFFRELADALEAKGEGELAGVEDFGKLKIAVEEEFEQISLKMRMKPKKSTSDLDEDDDDTEEKGQLKYKTLKKRMKSSFKIIFNTVKEGQLPPEAVIGSFLADSALMVGYPGHGDEHYEEYTTTCAALEKAFKEGDVEKMTLAVNELAAQKGRCHAQYD